MSLRKCLAVLLVFMISAAWFLTFAPLTQAQTDAENGVEESTLEPGEVNGHEIIDPVDDEVEISDSELSNIDGAADESILAKILFAIGLVLSTFLVIFFIRKFLLKKP